MQHPVLLPKSCRIAELVVRWYHEQVAHAGWGMTINQIRSLDFWVTRCNSLVRCISWSMSSASSWEEGFSNKNWQICPIREWVRNHHLHTVGGLVWLISCEGWLEGRQKMWCSVYLSVKYGHTHWGCILSEHWFIYHDLKKTCRRQR